MDKEDIISREEALNSLKVSLYILLKIGVPIKDLLNKINQILNEIYDINDISFLSTDIPVSIIDENEISYGGLKFNMARRKLFYNDKALQLSPTYSSLVQLFIQKPNKLITHKEIVKYVHGEISDKDPAKTCRPLISRLRSYFKQLSDNGDWIETISGEGYVFIGDINKI